jgi:hypothetical protein
MNIKEQFYVPLEVRSRRGRGGEFSFVAWQDVANRLNEMFGIHWSSELKTSEIVGANVIVRVRVTVKDPETNVDYWQEGFGGAINDERLEAGSPFKAAYSKAIKDACKRWGLGLYLEDDDKSSDVVAPTVIPTIVPTPPKQSEAPAGIPSIPTSIPAPVVESQPELNPFIPVPPVPTNELTFTVPPATSIPPTSTVAVPSIPSTPKSEDFVRPGGINIGKSGISDVQKVALEGLLLSRNVAFGVLAREAFDANNITEQVPASKDDLTYDEAVLIIKYGNDKLRRI